MLNFRNCRMICKGQKDILKLSKNAFSSKGKDPKIFTETVTMPSSEERQRNEYANWELLGLRGYRFCLPGNVGLSPQKKQRSVSFKKVPRPRRASQSISLPDTSYMRHMEMFTQLAVLAGELAVVRSEPHTFHCQAMDCPYLLRDQVLDIFPRANVGQGPLTAVCVALKYIPNKVDKDLKKIIQRFEETARRVCSKLSRAGFWADFPLSAGISAEEVHSHTAAQVEAAHTLPGMRILHLTGCILLLHKPLEESNILGWLFTTASLDDPQLAEILHEENS